MEETEKKRKKSRGKHGPKSQNKTVKRIKRFWHNYWGIFIAVLTGLFVGKYIIPMLFQ